MERNRRPAPSESAPETEPAVTPPRVEASFLDSLMDVFEGAAETVAEGGEARLSRQLREAIGARLRDAA